MNTSSNLRYTIRKCDVIFTMVLCCAIACSSSTLNAENAAIFETNGVAFKLTTDKYAYDPDNILRITYQVENHEHVGVIMVFPSNACEILVNTPSGMARNSTAGPTGVGAHNIKTNEILSSTFEMTLNKFDIYRDESVFRDIGTVSDGDTLIIRGRSLASEYGIEMSNQEMLTRAYFEQIDGTQIGDSLFDSLFDRNFDGKISFDDLVIIAAQMFWVYNLQPVPETATLQLKVIIRTVTADVNRDNKTDFADFIAFAKTFGAQIGQGIYDSRSDLDGNGTIEFADFILFAQNYGKEEGG